MHRRAIGMEGFKLPLWRSTVFRHRCEESMNSLQSDGYMVSREILRRYATRRSETNTNRTEFDSIIEGDSDALVVDRGQPGAAVRMTRGGPPTQRCDESTSRHFFWIGYCERADRCSWWDEVTGEWRKLHNIELHTLYSSLDIIRNIKSRRLRWAGHVSRMGESKKAYRVLVGRPERKRLLGKPRCRLEDNIKMDLREVGYDDGDWINLA
ncbi:hypothetical protein ANN_03041 [Periplaneta americana]|uniref:Uncharacterized protein n=1 Tax=Periplaneta americana TaxID=6978 RepID=A0ABQ8TXX5_PERAM|nr:hypothetical protein ANN_03041 [Periplaneta americana]